MFSLFLLLLPNFYNRKAISMIKTPPEISRAFVDYTDTIVKYHSLKSSFIEYEDKCISSMAYYCLKPRHQKCVLLGVRRGGGGCSDVHTTDPDKVMLNQYERSNILSCWFHFLNVDIKKDTKIFREVKPLRYLIPISSEFKAFHASPILPFTSPHLKCFQLPSSI